MEFFFQLFFYHMQVDLPNHYVSRSLHDLSQKELIEKINRVTEFSMKQIEDLKRNIFNKTSFCIIETSII